MKINDSQRIGAYRIYNQQTEQRTNRTQGGSRKDEVQFSAEALELLGSGRGPEGAERSKRIESLKNEVASGTYYVDAGAIAEKLLPFLTNRRP